MIEVWNDCGGDLEPTFLGMCLFPVHDLTSSTPTQTRIIALQRRFSDADNSDHVGNNAVDTIEDSLSQSTVTIMVSLASAWCGRAIRQNSDSLKERGGEA